jgi:hypothetical protein
MQDHDVQPSGLTRRGVLGGMGIASLTLIVARDGRRASRHRAVPLGEQKC